MQIWKMTVTLDELNHSSRNTLVDHLGIQFVKIGPDFLEASMPVDPRTHQPMGLLHGGASVVLAETLGSMASAMVVGPRALSVGIEVSASHLKGAREGVVYGRVTPARLGRSIHVWNIQIREAEDLQSPLICQARLSVMVKAS